MKTSDFYYHLPEELIAQHPVEPRDSARLLVYNKQEKTIEHKIFTDIVSYLKPTDVLVINQTKVIPARLYGHKKGCTGVMEILLLKRLNLTDYETLVKPGKRLKVGAELVFSDNLTATIIANTEAGGRVIRFTLQHGTLENEFERIGEMPLPHYIKEKLKNNADYQTVYAKVDGSAAAPTAGLHFTANLLEKIEKMGVKIVKVLLHVGLGTFRPVQVDDVTKHVMHSEYMEVLPEVAQTLNQAKQNGNRIIAVGTTTVRTLESAADEQGVLHACKKETNIFIYPGYKFTFVDALITNFHLPESTLIMLVSALTTKEETLHMYEVALKEKYRFFSFGDAMFIY